MVLLAELNTYVFSEIDSKEIISYMSKNVESISKKCTQRAGKMRVSLLFVM